MKVRTPTKKQALSLLTGYLHNRVKRRCYQGPGPSYKHALATPHSESRTAQLVYTQAISLCLEARVHT